MAAIDITRALPSGELVPGNFNFADEGLKEQKRVVSRYFDCTVFNLLTTNTYDVLAYEANTLVTDIGIVGIAAEATNTLAIGDSAGTFTWRTAAAVAAGAVRGTTILGFYSAAGKIRFTIGTGNLVAAKFWLWMETVQLS